MLELVIKQFELFDEVRQEFTEVPETTLRLEHSLVSISKWESKWKLPFIDTKEKTTEQVLDYIKCMTIGQNINPLVYYGLGRDDLEKVKQYIEEEQTATTFNSIDRAPSSNRFVTSELIYYWMTVYNVPFECQKWNLSRLLALLRIASIENAPKKKMSKRAVMDQNRALNKARRQARRSKG